MTNSTPTDWRGLCEELLLSWDADGCDWKPQHQARWNATVDRARAALAQPEPEVVGPSDDDLAPIYHDCCGGCDFMDQGGFEDAARAVLARWGNRQGLLDSSAPAPAGEVGDPPTELVEQWLAYAPNPLDRLGHVAIQAARWGAAQVTERQAAPVPAGEVAELVAWLRAYCDEEFAPLSIDPDVSWLTRAADLLYQQQADIVRLTNIINNNAQPHERSDSD